MEQRTEPSSPSTDPEILHALEQFPAEVLEAALLILQERQSKANN